MQITAIYLSEAVYCKVLKLLEPTMSIDLKTHITITNPPDKEAAWMLIDEFAVANGLPSLPDGKHYGLSGERELIAP